ncbi:MAG TPA: DNA polymerase [Dissulfurispiraceae bacterium]|nr:DNA polymerase [Dissulfurispiraceae bacterium]
MRYIHGSGPDGAKILLVGEAPGEQEEFAGKPFVGTAGGELDRELADAGISRHSCYVTNVVKHRPPGNDISQWIISPTKKRPAPTGFVPYRDRYVAPSVKEHIEDLWREINAVQPNVIVPLGGTALWVLTGHDSITSWRGSIIETKGEDGRTFKCIPTYHPAAVLRQYPWRWDAVQDFRRVRAEAEFPQIKDPKWNFLIRPTYDATIGILNWLLARLDGGESLKLVVDIETIPRALQLACIGLGWSKTDAICIPFISRSAHDGNYWPTMLEEMSIIQLLTKILTHPFCRVVGQNFLYDATWLAFLWGFRCVPWMDTMLAQHTAYPGKEKALDYISSIYCTFYRYWKDESKEWHLKGDEAIYWTYNCQDCAYTWECAEVLLRVLEKRELQEQFDFQMSLFAPALDMMIRGIREDDNQRRQLYNIVDKQMQRKLKFIHEVFGHEVNPRSPVQLKALFYDDLKIKPVLNRKGMKKDTASISVNDEALEIIKKREPVLVPVCEAIKEYRTLGVFKGNVLGTEGPRDRMLCSFNLAGAETFRWSSSQNPFGWGANMQNIAKLQVEDPPDVQAIAKEIRRLFIPDEGMILAKFDLEKADLQVVVWEADDMVLKQRLRERVDIHAENAKDIGMSRQMAKTFVHLTNYGGKAITAAKSCGITVHAAEHGQKRWFQAHPGILDWHRRVEAQLQSTRTVANKFGYKRFYFDRIDSVFNEALAWIPQSTVAICINKTLKAVSARREIQLLLQVHDEIVVQWAYSLGLAPVEQINAIFNSIIVPYEDPLIIPAECKLSVKSWGDCVDLKQFKEECKNVCIPGVL